MGGCGCSEGPSRLRSCDSAARLRERAKKGADRPTRAAARLSQDVAETWSGRQAMSLRRRPRRSQARDPGRVASPSRSAALCCSGRLWLLLLLLLRWCWRCRSGAGAGARARRGAAAATSLAAAGASGQPWAQRAARALEEDKNGQLPMYTYVGHKRHVDAQPSTGPSLSGPAKRRDSGQNGVDKGKKGAAGANEPAGAGAFGVLLAAFLCTLARCSPAAGASRACGQAGGIDCAFLVAPPSPPPRQSGSTPPMRTLSPPSLVDAISRPQQRAHHRPSVPPPSHSNSSASPCPSSALLCPTDVSPNAR